jgi:hypothetical protein
LEWLDARVLRPRLAANPSLAGQVAQLLKELMLGLIDQHEHEELEDDSSYAESEIVIARLILEFPESIRAPLLGDPEVLQKLPLEHRPSVSFGGAEWKADEFFRAAANALSDGHARIQEERERPALSLERKESWVLAIKLSNGAEGLLADPALELLDEDITRRRACLERNTSWIDRPAIEAESRRAEIIGLPSGAERMLALDDERAESAAFTYQKLADAIREQPSTSRSLFEPSSVESLMRYLRLSGDASLGFANSLAAAASQLVDDVGPLQALERLAALPVETPGPLVDLLNEMPKAEREQTLSALARRALSPLSRAHSIALLRRYVAAEVVVEHLSRFLADGRERVEASITVLRWAERVFERRIEWRSLPRTSRLALVWTHADRITQLLFQGGAPPDHIVREIGPWDPRAFVPWLLHSPAEESDPASPGHQQAASLWFRLLGYAVGEEVQAWLPAETVAAMRATISMDTGETGLWPDRFLIAEPSDTNALESFLARPWPHLARAFDEEDFGEGLTGDFAAQVLDQAFATLEQDNRAVAGWGV